MNEIYGFLWNMLGLILVLGIIPVVIFTSIVLVFLIIAIWETTIQLVKHLLQIRLESIPDILRRFNEYIRDKERVRETIIDTLHFGLVCIMCLTGILFIWGTREYMRASERMAAEQLYDYSGVYAKITEFKSVATSTRHSSHGDSITVCTSLVEIELGYGLKKEALLTAHYAKVGKIVLVAPQEDGAIYQDDFPDRIIQPSNVPWL